MNQVKRLLFSLTAGQRWAILICAIAVGAGVVGLSRWQHESGLRPLYTSLAPEDASAIVQKLRESGVDYRITDNGTTLLVPDGKAPELRLEMAGLGLPKTGRIGFEIFDKTNFGITDFAEHVNYRRAVEGELERSILALAEVQQARVHVTLPKDSVFLESRESAKASVLVGLRPGARLAAQNVTAITNLVSSAVEGLTADRVSVVDMHGNLLSRPRRDDLSDSAEATNALDYRQALERDLIAKINNTLEPLLGADKFRTGVSAEVDMTSGEQSEESFDPTRSVMLTSQKTEDSNGVTHLQSAPPGTAANLPNQPAATPAPQTAGGRPAGNTTGSVKRTENVTFQSSRTTKHVKLPQGAIKRLSVAVLVDQSLKWEGQGNQLRRMVVPPEPEKLKTIQSIVSALVGLNPQRGDQLTVETLPFDATLNMEPPSATPPPSPKKTGNPSFLDSVKSNPVIAGAVAGGVLILAVLIFALARSKRNRMTVEMEAPLPLPAASPSETASLDTTPAQNVPALNPTRAEVLLTQLRDSGKKNPELWAGILSGWLNEGERG